MKSGIKTLTLVAAGLVLAALTSCGGGGSTAIVNAPHAPAPGTADLHGQLVQGARGVSSAGDSMAGIPVALIDAVSGALLRSGVTDGSGKFEFKAVPSGSEMMIKVEFTSSVDLDRDGVPDQVELRFPLSLADQSVTDFLQKISMADTNADSSPDAIEVETEVGDDQGRHEQSHEQHRHMDGTTVQDSNGNGVIDDSDDSFDDSDGDNLPDDNGGQFGESEVSGAIEAISANSITVGGITFTITSATELQIGDNHHAALEAFSLGIDVKVEGFIAASGELIASEIKDSAAMAGSDDQFGDDNGGDDVNDDNGVDGNGSDDAAGDDSGADDNGTDDVADNGGQGSYDTTADDNGGQGADDAAGDDSGNDSSADDKGGDNGSGGGGDDNSGHGGGDDNGGGA